MKSATEYHDEFWAFSLDRYGRDGVSAICLKLQEVCWADVNIILFCLWRGQQRHGLEAQVITKLIEGEAGHWHRDVVLSLRAARKAMKGRSLAGDGIVVEKLRDEVKRIEIESERLEQLSLVGILTAFPMATRTLPADDRSTQEISLANVTNYISTIAPQELENVTGLLHDLTAKCFP